MVFMVETEVSWSDKGWDWGQVPCPNKKSDHHSDWMITFLHFAIMNFI